MAGGRQHDDPRVGARNQSAPREGLRQEALQGAALPFWPFHPDRNRRGPQDFRSCALDCDSAHEPAGWCPSRTANDLEPATQPERCGCALFATWTRSHSHREKAARPGGFQVRAGELTGEIVHATLPARLAEADAQAEFDRTSTKWARVNHGRPRPLGSQSHRPRPQDQDLRLALPDEIPVRLVFRFCTCWSILFCYAQA
jgi:hypothetical protein